MAEQDIELSIVMPCLNEAETLAVCIDKAMGWLKESGTSGEVVIADNGSTDGSQEIARKHGARVVDVKRKGYGSALMGGIESARGKYVIMGDSDDSYDFSNLTPFIEKLREGYDLVMGNRFKGGIAPGAMPFKHRYLGNPVLTGIGKLFFRCPSSDFHCGLRGFSKEAYERISPVTTGMEFASELVIKATLNDMKIAEVPTTLSPDGRTRPPHLRSWRDGWRHLRFMLMYSPKWLFYYPGVILMVLGLLATLFLMFNNVTVGEVSFGVHSMLFASVAVIIGHQAIVLSMFAHDFAETSGLLLGYGWKRGRKKEHSVERGVVIGVLLFLVGIALAVYSTLMWAGTGFGEFAPQTGLRFVIPSATLMVLGVQVFMGSFFLGLLNMDRKRPDDLV